ncbi:unnamed protein product [Rhizophagus irregularis]|uniref:Uncharacterized protein n=1 Tax=Rhizophagus irregularis TaxID=588596 RepID=A0A916E7P5_9GLOM|nr:unnamed protein product [Rhizophagus irregularis]
MMVLSLFINPPINIMANSAHYKPWKKPWKRKQSSPDIAIYISPNIVLSPDVDIYMRALDAITICEDVYLNKVKATRNIPNSIDWIYYTSHLDDKLPTRKKMPDSSKIVLYATTQPFGKGLRIKPYEAMNGQQCGIHSLNGDMKI